MIVTEGKLRWLNKGQSQTLHVVASDWPMATPPREGNVYKLQLARGGKSLLSATAVEVIRDRGGDGWHVTLVRGDHRDVPRLLRARPNHEIDAKDRQAEDSDYTSRLGMAMNGGSDPGEAVPESYQAGISADASDRDHELRAMKIRLAREHIRRGAEILEGAGHHAKRAAREIRQHVDRIGGE
jgi:hypothetical protein